MTPLATNALSIPAIGHDEAMALADEEYQRVLALAGSLTDADWSQPTDCIGWDVKAVLGHLLGMLELQANAEERMRQVKTAAAIAAQTGGIRLNEMTALQVREHAHLTPAELIRALHEAVPRGLAARQGTTAEQRAAAYPTELPGEGPWTFGYLFDIIHTRDPWMHRVDISRAIASDPELTAVHDGRIVADVVAEWARRHQQPFQLALTGAAGGSYDAGDCGPTVDLDAVEFCRILSGRAQADGLLSTSVPF
jgi:uncharacterized protein (TIGR03083 family)